MTEPWAASQQRQPKHVWVDVTGGWGGNHTYPGLLLEWRKSTAFPDKWEALVSYAESSAHGWRMVSAWVPAEHVQPVK